MTSTDTTTLPAFTGMDIPDQWRAPVTTQCGECNKEFEDIKVETTTPHKLNYSSEFDNVS
jgi:hypothetical protein